MPLLEPVDYDSVRWALEVGMEASALPDEVIASSIYSGAAEDEILARDLDALTYTETGANAAKWRRVKAAAIYLTASLLAGALPRIAEVQFRNYRHRRESYDPEKRAAELRAAAYRELDAYLPEEQQTPFLGGFWAASGTRGR